MAREVGFIDPALLPPRSEQQRELFAAVLKHGMSLHLVHSNGRTVRLTGPGGVHVTAESVAWVKLFDVVNTNQPIRFSNHGHKPT